MKYPPNLPAEDRAAYDAEYAKTLAGQLERVSQELQNTWRLILATFAGSRLARWLTRTRT
jgi:hypothetical protein